MKILHHIGATVTGPLNEIDTPEGGPAIPPYPSLSQVLETLRTLSFIVEVMPDLKGNQTAQRAVAQANHQLATLTPEG